MEMLNGTHWSALSACSRQLRQLVQSRTRAIYIPYADDHQILIKHKRPQPSLIFIDKVKVEDDQASPWQVNENLELLAIVTLWTKAFVAQILVVKPIPCLYEHQLAHQSESLLAVNKWVHECQWERADIWDAKQGSMGAQSLAQLNAMGLQHLTKLCLANMKLDEATFKQLLTASWCDVKVLDVSYTGLNGAAVQLLVTGSWSCLECLRLDGNKLDDLSLSQLLAVGWPLQVSDIHLAFTPTVKPFGGGNTHIHTLITF